MTLQSAEIRLSMAAFSEGAQSPIPARFDPTHGLLLALAAGTDADEANLLYFAERTLAASTSEELDLAGGLTDAFGTTLTFAEIVAIVVFADEDNTNNVLVGGAASNAVPLLGDVSDVVPVKPGGAFMLAAPSAAGQCTVTAGTGDLLKVANSSSGSSVTYIIGLLGRTA